MKLIRMTHEPAGTNEKDKLIFNSTINEDMLIKPDSKVALQSISFETFNKDLIVNASNNTVRVNINGTYNANFELEEETYRSHEFDNFINDMEIKFNGGLAFNETVLGTEFAVYINSANFLRIDFQRGDIGTEDLELKNVQEVAGTYTRLEAGTGNNAFIYGRVPIARGAGYLRARIPNVPNNPDGVMLGLTSDAKSDQTNFINTEDIKYGIRVDNNSYYYIVNGVETQVADTPTNGDILEVQIDLGDIRIGYYNVGDININEIHAVSDFRDFPDTKNLYPAIVLQDQPVNNVSVDEVSFAGTPYEDDLQNVAKVSGLDAPEPYTGTYQWFVEWATLDFAQNLGFNTRITPTIKSDVDLGVLRAPKKFDQNNHHDHFVIELDNINLKSYDDEKKGRLNILAVTSETDDNLIFRFRPPYPTFMDIDNANPMTMRNIRMKVLDENLEIIESVGKSVAVLLFKDKDE
jgi:hypothetical protein